LTIRLDSMLQAVKLPTSVAHLATSLANVDGDTFPHDCLKLLFLDCKDNPKDLEIVGFGLTGADQSVKELGDFSQLTTLMSMEM